MQIPRDPSRLDPTISTPLSVNRQLPHSRLEDQFITMAPAKNGFERIQNFATGSVESIRNFARIAWEWIYWIIRLFPSENTRIETVEEIIENPEETGNLFKENPVENLGEIIAATLINPSKVDEYRKQNRKKVGEFLKKFREAGNLGTVLSGKNSTLKTITAFLNVFSGLQSNHLLVKFVLARPKLIAKGIKGYCQKVTETIGDKSQNNTELAAIKIVAEYFLKVAEQADKDRDNFKAFLESVFCKTNFNLEDVGATASKHLDNAKLSKEEESAFRTCSLNKQQAFVRLTTRPDLFTANLDNATLGTMTMWQSLIGQLDSEDFKELGTLFKEDYPLASEVCEHLEDISANSPSQFYKIVSNLPKAVEVLTAMKADFDHPPVVT